MDVEYQVLVKYRSALTTGFDNLLIFSLYQQCNLFEALEILQCATHLYTMYPLQRNLLGSCTLIVIWPKKKIIQLILTISLQFSFALNLHRWHNEVVWVVNLLRAILYVNYVIYNSIQWARRVHACFLHFCRFINIILILGYLHSDF